MSDSDWGFRLRTALGCILILLTIDGFMYDARFMPNRVELGPRDSELVLTPVGMKTEPSSPVQVAQAWVVESEDPRIGGVSSLGVDGDHLIGLTDSGVVFRFPKPKGLRVPVHIREVPRGPGIPTLRAFRDSEALARDPFGRGWWVGFENAHHVWLYDAGFTRALQRIRLHAFFDSGNLGIEGAARQGRDLLLFGEDGRTLVRVRDGRATRDRILNPRGRISDAASLGPGRTLAIERRPTLLGFRNSLMVVRQRQHGYELGERVKIPGWPIDNYEALAVDRSGERLRLWLMTDDNWEPPFRTLLLALDVDPEWLE